MPKGILQRRHFRNADQLERMPTYFISEAGTTLSIDNIATVLRDQRRAMSRMARR